MLRPAVLLLLCASVLTTFAAGQELPEGEWSVEVRTNGKGRPWLKADRLVKVPRGSAPFTLTLQMDRGNRPRGD